MEAKRYPKLWVKRRTMSSGLEFLLPTRDIIIERSGSIGLLVLFRVSSETYSSYRLTF